MNLMVYMFRSLGVFWGDQWTFVKRFLIIGCYFTIFQDMCYQLGVLLGLVANARDNTSNYTGKFIMIGTLFHTLSGFLSIQAIRSSENGLMTDVAQSLQGRRSWAYFLYVLIQDVVMFGLSSSHARMSAHSVSKLRLLYEIYYLASTVYVFYHTQYSVSWLVITCISLASRKVHAINEKLEKRVGDRTALVRSFRNAVDTCRENSARLAAIVHSNILSHVCSRLVTFAMTIFPCIHDPPIYRVPKNVVLSVLTFMSYVLVTNIIILFLMSSVAEKYQSRCKETRRLIRRMRLENNADNEDLMCAINLAPEALGLKAPVLGILGYKVSFGRFL